MKKSRGHWQLQEVVEPVSTSVEIHRQDRGDFKAFTSDVMLVMSLVQYNEGSTKTSRTGVKELPKSDKSNLYYYM